MTTEQSEDENTPSTPHQLRGPMVTLSNLVVSLATMVEINQRQLAEQNKVLAATQELADQMLALSLECPKCGTTVKGAKP